MVYVPVERRRPAPVLVLRQEAQAERKDVALPQRPAVERGGASAVLKVSRGGEIFRVLVGWPFDCAEAHAAVLAALTSSGCASHGSELRLWYCDEEGVYHEVPQGESIQRGEQAPAACSSAASTRGPAVPPWRSTGGPPPAKAIRLCLEPPGDPAAASAGGAAAAEGCATEPAAAAAPGAAATVAPAAEQPVAAEGRAERGVADVAAAASASDGTGGGSAAAARPAPAAAAVASAARLLQGWMVPGDDPELRAALEASEELGRAVEASKAEARERLSKVLKLYEARLKPVQGDGNCQFRALSLQLYGEQDHHAALRQRVVEQLRARRERYEPYVQGSFDEYLERMERDREWGDNVTLQAASDMLGCEIRVLTDQLDSAVVELHPLEPVAGAPQRPLCLAFVTEVHYDAAEVD